MIGNQFALGIFIGVCIGFLGGGWIVFDQCRKEVTISFQTMVVKPDPAGNPVSVEERDP